MLALYRLLLRLYPQPYRREYADEMTGVFSRAQQDISNKKLLVRTRFRFREIQGVLAGALHQRFRFPDWNLFRRFDMHPEFRFPRSTIFLMLVILAGVFLTIEKAKVVQMRYGSGLELMAVWSVLPWSLIFVLALICVCVALGWGILFALHRSGMHRLANLQTEADPR